RRKQETFHASLYFVYCDIRDDYLVKYLTLQKHFIYLWWHGGSVACTACTSALQQEGHRFDSRMGCCWLWGAGPMGYLPGVSVWSVHVLPVFTRGFLP